MPLVTDLTVSYECGGHAYPNQNFCDAYPVAHAQMRNAMREIASKRGSAYFESIEKL